MKSARRRAKPLNSGRGGGEPDSVTEAVRYLARGERSEAQIRRYLIKKGFGPAAVARAVGRLHRMGYLDDEAAALRLAQARLARLPMSREALAAALEARGFAAGTAARAVRGAYAGASEEAFAERALRDLPRRFADPVRESRRRAALLRGRGFSDDISEAVLASSRFMHEAGR